MQQQQKHRAPFVGESVLQDTLTHSSCWQEGHFVFKEYFKYIKYIFSKKKKIHFYLP